MTKASDKKLIEQRDGLFKAAFTSLLLERQRVDDLTRELRERKGWIDRTLRLHADYGDGKGCVTCPGAVYPCRTVRLLSGDAS